MHIIFIKKIFIYFVIILFMNFFYVCLFYVFLKKQNFLTQTIKELESNIFLLKNKNNYLRDSLKKKQIM